MLTHKPTLVYMYRKKNPKFVSFEYEEAALARKNEEKSTQSAYEAVKQEPHEVQFHVSIALCVCICV